MRTRNLLISGWIVAPLLLNPALADQGEKRQEDPREHSFAQESQLPRPQWAPDRNYDQQHIRLELRFDWDREQAFGTATITLAPLTAGLRRVEFDAANMTVSAVALESGAQLAYEASDEKLAVQLDRAYEPGDQIALVVTYHTNGMSMETSVRGLFRRGLTWVQPAPGDPRRPRQIWSQGEPENNHFWFPSFDHPNDFTTTELLATVDPPLQVISNGSLREIKDNPDGTRTFHWEMEIPHAVYLTSLVVGEFASIESSYDRTPVTSYVPPGRSEEGRATVARTAEMVAFLSGMTGVPYPYEKYAQTFAHGFRGGVEFISATTLSDELIHDGAPEAEKRSDGVIVHELAHQWFGDYVTCRTWADLWLNEGFATYATALWNEHRFGHDDFLYTDVKGNQDRYYQAWNQGLRRPLVTRNYSSIDDLIDVYSYQRGAAVLHMLRKVLGEEDWGRAVTHYLVKYAHAPVETEQLRIAVEDATGRPMDWFFEEWVYRMGHPVFRVTQSYDSVAQRLALTVRQERAADRSSPYPQTALFRTPVEIEIGTASGTRVERVTIAPVLTQTFTFEVDSRPLLVGFDYENTLLKELRFEKTAEELVYQVVHDEDLSGRLWALGELSERSRDTTRSEADRERIVAAMASALTDDAFWGVRVEAAAALQPVKSEVARTALLAAATSDPDARVRARAAASLAAGGG